MPSRAPPRPAPARSAPPRVASGAGPRLLHGLGESGQELEQVAHHAVVRDLEDVGVRVLVDRDDHLARRHAREVLDRAGDAERDVEVGRDGLPRLADLLLVRAPPGVGHRARRTGRGAEGVGQLLEELPVLRALEAATTGHDDARLAQRDAFARGRGGLEARELQFFGARVRRDRGRLHLGRARRERPRARADREHRRQRYAQRRSDLARVHRPLHLERAVLRRRVGAVRGVGPAQLRGDTRREVPAIQRRADEDDVDTTRLRALRDRVRVRDRLIAVGAGDLDDVDVAERCRLRRDLRSDATQLAVTALGDDQDLHRTFASSCSRRASSTARAFTSPSAFRIFPPPRCGGGSIATTSARGAPAVTPSAARSFSGMSFFFAFMIPGRLGYRGSLALLWTRPTTGSGVVHTSWPPSISRHSSTPSSPAAIFVSMPPCGQPSASARAGPTRPWSSSDACFSHSTTSGFASFATAACVFAMSRPPAFSSAVTSVASSQPIASAWRSASRERAGPTVTTLTVVDGSPSLCSSASSIAYSSYGEIDQVMPSVATDFPSAATLTRTVESGTCFRQTRNFTSDDLLVVRVAQADPDREHRHDDGEERAHDPGDRAAVGQIHQFVSKRAATSSSTSTGLMDSCTPLAPTPSSSMIRQYGQPLATLVAPDFVASS